MIEKTFIEQGMRNIELKKYLKKELSKAGFTGMDVHKTPLVTRIVLRVTRPGLAIGKGGKNIKILTDEIASKFKVENPQIEISEVENPSLNSAAQVTKIVSSLESGYSWRSVAFRTVESIMRAGAQGVELIMAGMLGGKGSRARKQRIAKGYMKKAGSQSDLVDYAQGSAHLKVGAVGIKLRIIGPDIEFPDKINIRKFLEEKEKSEEKKKEETEEKDEKKTEEEKTEETKEKKSEEKDEKKDEKTKQEKDAEEKEDKAGKGEKKKEEAKEKKPRAKKDSGEKEKTKAKGAKKKETPAKEKKAGEKKTKNKEKKEKSQEGADK